MAILFNQKNTTDNLSAGDNVQKETLLGHQSVEGKENENQKKFREENPKWTFEDIVLRKEVRDTLEDVILFCQNKDKLIKEWDLDKFLKGNSSIGINFYGEPGTGKTISAEAIASALGRKVIKADYSEIQDSKWGATEKNLTSLFRKAEETGSIIILDEADGLLGKRANSGTNANTANDIKSHLLTLVDKSNVLIFYTTNLFKNFDRAFFRRILYHINIPMPNKEELEALWKFHLGDKANITGDVSKDRIPKNPSDFSYDTIANACVGELAGGDVKNITLKLCVKLSAGKIKSLTSDDVLKEIDTYKKSLDDSRGVQTLKSSEVPDDVKKELNVK